MGKRLTDTAFYLAQTEQKVKNTARNGSIPVSGANLNLQTMNSTTQDLVLQIAKSIVDNDIKNHAILVKTVNEQQIIVSCCEFCCAKGSRYDRRNSISNKIGQFIELSFSKTGTYHMDVGYLGLDEDGDSLYQQAVAIAGQHRVYRYYFTILDDIYFIDIGVPES